LTFDLFSPQLCHVTGSSCWTYLPILKFIGHWDFEICGHKDNARPPSLPWQLFCAPLVEGSSTCQPPTMKLIGPPTTELLQFLTEYVAWPCDLDFWPLDLGVMSRDATRVVNNTCAKFEMYATYRSRVMTIPIVNWPPDESPNFHVFGGKWGHISNFIFLTPKCIFLAERRIMTYWAWGRVQRCDLWSWWRKEKKRTETFMRQTGYLPRPPTST